MDKGEQRRDFKWLPAHMPTVAQLMVARRRELGDAHVNECWRRGVLQGEPGWFYAREGPLAVGTPWPDPAEAKHDRELELAAGGALLWVRTP